MDGIVATPAASATPVLAPTPPSTSSTTDSQITSTSAPTTQGVVAAMVAAIDVSQADGTMGDTTPAGATPGSQLVLGSPGGGSGGVVVGSVTDKFTMEYIEGVALQNFDFVATIPQQEPAREEGSTTWRTLMTRCRQMGFLVEDGSAWNFLGIPKMESADPDKNIIKGRSGILKDILETTSDASLDPEETAKRARLIYKLGEYRDECLKELPEVLKLRKESRKGRDKLMRWAEIDLNTRIGLGKDFGTGTLEALSLSNILEADNGLIHIDVEQARTFTGNLWKGGKDAVETMKTIEGKEIIIWCPTSKEDVGRLASAIVKGTEAGIRCTVTVLIPLDPKPKCHEVSQFTDLWSHELVSGKWAAFTRSTRFSAKPVKIVVSGSFAPMHQTKSLCMVSLTTEGGRNEMTMLHSRGSIGRLASREIVVVVDLAEEEEIEFVKMIGIMREEVIAEWHGPSRAPSSRAGEKRILYAGVVKEAGAWAARMAVMRIKVHLNPLDVVVGLHSTFGNPDSILIDMSGGTVGAKVQKLVEDAVMVSPRLMVARSTASEKQWKERTEAIFHQNGEYIEKVRYRTSQGGNTIAIPPVLQEQKDRKKKEVKGNDDKLTQIIVRLRGEFIEAQEDQAPRIVQMIAEKSQTKLDEEESAVVAGKHQWKKIKDPRTGWKGDILIKCSDEDEVIKIYRLIEGKALELGDDGRITVEVIPHARLAIEARNRASPL